MKNRLENSEQANREPKEVEVAFHEHRNISSHKRGKENLKNLSHVGWSNSMRKLLSLSHHQENRVSFFKGHQNRINLYHRKITPKRSKLRVAKFVEVTFPRTL